MKKLIVLVAGLCAFAFLTPSVSFAAKGDKKKGGVDVLGRFDKNHNGVLDPDEKEALKKEFATDASLKVLDTDNDGKLSDDEINAAAKPAKKKKKDK
jgi:hypothetical protein